MKRFLLIASCLLTLSQIPSFSHSQSPEIIPIIEIEPPEGQPRGMNEISIRAYYLSGTVIVSFLQNLGNVEISIDEESNGTIYQSIIDSSTLTAILPLNLSSGEFTINFTVSSGAEYYGHFSL